MDFTRTFAKTRKRTADITRTWTRGKARVEGNEIILDAERSKPYPLFGDPEQRGRLLMDLAGLRHLGSIGDMRVANPEPAISFAKRHGLLWHRPDESSDDKAREHLQRWLIEGHELSISIALYMSLRESIDKDSTKPLQTYLLPLRDLDIFYGAMPADNKEFQEGLSVILAERISRGLEGCTPTIIAACGLERGNGEKEGPAGDFRASINPSNLVAVAYDWLVAMIESKAWFKECVGCGELFRMKPEFHTDRAYCDDACYDRTRKRKQRAKDRGPQ